MKKWLLLFFIVTFNFQLSTFNRLYAQVSDTTSYLKVSDRTFPANGIAVCTVTVTVKTDTGVPLQGKQVTIYSSRGSQDTITQPTTTDSNGQCTGTIKSEYCGGSTVTARCDGNTIVQNLVPNPSFEDGTTGWDMNSSTIDSSNSHTGTSSSRLVTTGGDVTGSRQTNYMSIANDAYSTYEVSGYIKANVTTGNYYFQFYFYDSSDAYIAHEDVTLLSSTSDWVFASRIYGGSGSGAPYTFPANCTQVRISNSWWNTSPPFAEGTGWVDDFRFRRIPTINFTGTRFKITTPARTTTINNPSAYITVEAQDGVGNRDTTFNGTVTLQTSTANGTFSLDRVNWANTSVITLSAGSAIFYYKDSASGNPIITVSRAGFTSDTRVVSIVGQGVNETASYITFTPYQIPASGVNSATTVVTINDTYGFPITNKLVTLQTTRGNSDTIQDSMGAVNSKQYTDNNGMCTWTIKSVNVGLDTITAVCDGKTITRGVNKYGAAGIWHFDTDTKDVSGYGNDATLYNGPLWASAPDSAAQGCALQFDGINDYAQTPSSSSLDISSAITMELWFKPNNVIPNQKLALLYDGSNHKVIFGIINGTIYPDLRTNSGNNYSWNGSSISNGNWYHYALSYLPGESLFRIYLNGSEIGTGATDGNPLTSPGTSFVYVGGWGTNYPFNGIIDEVKIYNRVLSAAEIKSSYESRTNFRFTATKLKFTTSSFTTTLNNASPTIQVEVQGGAGIKDDSFNDTVLLQSGSGTGKFSLSRTSWVDTNVIYFSNGQAVFYYKDSNPGNSVITVSREELQSDTQVVSIVGPTVNETASYITFTPYQIPADNTSRCTAVVTINDTYGFPIVNKLVTLQTTRGNSDTILDSMGVVRNTQTTNVNGICTFTIRSGYVGLDTITAVCDGKTITRGVNKYGAAGIWHFDTDAKDVSGYGNNATLYGPLWTSAPDSSAQGSAIQFNGYNDYALASNYGGTDAISFSFWFKANRVGNGGTGDPSCDMIQHTDWSTNGWWIEWRNSGYLGLGVFTAGVPSSFEISTFTDTTTWHYLDGTVTRNGAVKVWLDNVQEVNSTIGNWTDASVNLLIGSGTTGAFNPDSYNQYFSGIIDEVRIYNRALSDDEIKAIYEKRTNIYFASNRLKITTPPCAATVNNPSSYITAEVQDGTGNRDVTFNGTVELSSSSPGGKFSLDRTIWQNTTTIMLSSGYGIFYYKDSSSGNPVITISRSGFTSDSQVVSVVEPGVNETASYITFTPYQTPADGTSICSATVTINDTYGFPIANKLVTLQTTRGNSDTINDSTGAVNSKQYTDNNGMCTWTIKSGYGGLDTITAACDGKTIARGVNKYGAVGIWHFDTDTKDVSGQGNNGTAYNGPLWTSAPDSAAQGCALQFDGVNDYVDCGNNFSFDIRDAITIEAWIKLNTIFSDFYRHICGKPTFPMPYTLLVDWTAGNPLTFIIHSGGVDTRIGGGSLSDLQWHHIVATYNRNEGYMRLYQDGVQVNAEFKGNLIIDTNTDPVRIGGDGDVKVVPGIIDEVKIYNRCLSANEIKAAYDKKANINLNATKLKFLTSPQTIVAGAASEAIVAEARGDTGSRDESFNNTVTLSSSSLGGKFSMQKSPWADTNVISFTLGSATFYYKDSQVGNPTITAYRTGLIADSQTETITPSIGLPGEATSYLVVSSSSIPADGISTCTVTVIVKDNTGTVLAGKTVTISTFRGSSYDTITQPGLTDVNGQCTAVVKSGYAGEDTITASCEGRTITQNLILNPSFEDGWSSWSPLMTSSIDTTTAYSGAYSLLSANIYADTAFWGAWGEYVNASAGEKYSVSGWIKADSYGGGTWRRINLTSWNSIPAFIGQDGPTIDTGTYGWQYIQKTVTTPSGTVFIKISSQISQTSGAGTVWVDDIRVKRVPTINFAPTQLKITTPPRTTIRGSASDSICIEAWDKFARDTTFNNTVALQTSSSSGKFSLSSTSWSDVNIITLSAGSGIVCYKDIVAGTYTITVSRSGLISGTQTIVVFQLAGASSETSSYFVFSPYQVRADGTYSCTIVIIMKDTYTFPMAGVPVTLSSSRGSQDTIYDSIGGNVNPQATDLNGQCTFTVKSGYAGWDTMSVTSGGKTISRGINKYLASGIWCLDGDADDISGNGNNGTLYNGPVWVDGKFGQALQFDGYNDYVSTPNYGGTDAISFSFWFKADRIGNGGTGILSCDIIQHTDWANNGWWIEWHNDGDLQFSTFVSGAHTPFTISSGFTDTVNWHYLAGTVTRNGAVKIWLDNVQEVNSTIGNWTDASVNLLMGTGVAGGVNDPGSNNQFFKGIIDEVKIYNRALSADEIKAGYENRANVYFGATKLGFVTPQLKAKAGSSSLVTISAGGSLGGIDASYPNTTVLLSSSSNSGSFSVDGNTVASVTLSSGQASFYYRDYKLGNPVITLTHPYASLDTGTQVETITASQIKIGSLPFTISTINTSPQITMVAQGYFNETDTNFKETVSLSSSSSVGKFSVSNTIWKDTTTLQFNSGQAVFYYKDRRGGNPTIAVLQPELALSASQQETITMPVITISKIMTNVRTSISGILISATAEDTIEYTITIKNDGTETAIGIVLTDTVAFDTNNYSPLAFVSMDTADTYAYTTDPLGVTWITGSPSSGQEGVKGLRWKINTLIPAEEKQLKFRVRVK